ncbi:TIM barrel protein [Aliiglaciecola sp. 3_MG-2023]|uniref:TIM barrel protein n=1 Tax=Aliiglaciecola sp. 3_MG-2023 TaxID=3062644 RepID=UPI0026E36A80|nr:TIM barrel protein [Aliiglaciecola sp. 3_MG-2023]MDO6693292.1 TIM barrel protein [Aliiglaciecola sp. 3_MG-2023]
MDRRQFIARSTAAAIAASGLSACSNTNPSIIEKSQTDIMPLPERQRWLRSFSCNIEQWFRPMPFLDRINAAKALGFSAVEIWNPYQEKRGKTPESIAQRAQEQGIRITTYSPNAPAMADPKNEEKFLQWLEMAIAAGKTLKVANFNLTGHKLVEGLSIKQMVANYTRVLKLAVPRLEAENMMATIEPYNPFNHKGDFLYGNEPALSICREINSPSIKLNWDFFHMQRSNGNLITHLESGFEQIGYVQFADSPGRNQPGTGEVAYDRVFTKLRDLGYKGYIGAEFFPKDKDQLKAASDIAKIAKRINLADTIIT